MARPFDPKAASLYGQFVQAAYSMYNAAPTNLRPPKSDDFPDGYDMVAWIQMQDFVLESTAPLFYGFIAQSAVAPNEFVVAIRGTSNGVEWWDDFTNAVAKVPFKIPNCGMVGEGFARIYDTLEVVECAATPTAAPRSMRPAGTFSEQISALIRRHPPTAAPARRTARGRARATAPSPSASVEVTGHSLGAALATLYTLENAQTTQIANPMLCTFASPLVGDGAFASVFNGLNLTSWRVDNVQDWVTKMPPAILGFAHVDTEVSVNSEGEVTPSVFCWHSLATYLSLIDPAKQPDAGCRLVVTTAAPPPPVATARSLGTPPSISGHGWELYVQRLGVHVSGSKKRTYGSYQVFQDGRALDGLSGFICECIGPGENTVPGTSLRIAQGTYPLSTQFGRYRTVGYSDDTSTAGTPPMPAILVEHTINRSGILIHPGHPPNLFLSSIGCFNPTSALLSWQEIDFWDSRSRVIALIDDLRRFAPDAFDSLESTMISNASIVVDGEPMNILVSPDEAPPLAGAAGGEVPVATARSLGTPLSATQVFRPVAIDLYEGDNVQDTPGPLGGFARVKASGIAFLLHKASRGVNGVDARYRARRAAWMNGIPVTVTDVDGEVLQLIPKFAAYHFLMGEDPEAEARHFLDTAQLQPGDDAVVDWEQSPGGTTPSVNAVDAFCSVVEQALGFPIIVYSGNVAKELLSGVDARFAKRRLWLAQYNSTFKVQESWSYPWLWQNNGDDIGPGPHSIPGIDGNCDNSTIAITSGMTIKRLYDEWAGGSQALVAREAVRRVSVLSGSRPYARPIGFTGTPRKIARYGWKPDLPDQRDHSYAVSPSVISNISATVDLRSQCPQVYDQGQIGSCTANAIAAALEFDMIKQKLSSFTPSRLFIYYNERSMEGTVGSDAGAFIRDGIKSVASQGDCPESEWTYDGSPAEPSGVFPLGAKAAMAPSQQCYADAIRHQALTYQSIDQNLTDMKGCLSSGYPFVFGFTVYPSFESDDVAHTGIVPMPAIDEQTIGGHAVLAVGYDDTKNMFIVRNSWGTDWGAGGYCYMPYAYLLDDNLASDFWTIRVVD